VVFGIEGGSQAELISEKEQVFSAFLLKSWAHLTSFSPSLPQQHNILYPPAIRMEGMFEGGGTQGSLRLALFTAAQGNIANSWLAFSLARDVLYVHFQGEYRCEAEDCRLNATCSESIPPSSANPYFRRGDKIVLSRKGTESFQGAIEAAGREVFKGGNQIVKY